MKTFGGDAPQEKAMSILLHDSAGIRKTIDEYTIKFQEDFKAISKSEGKEETKS